MERKHAVLVLLLVTVSLTVFSLGVSIPFFVEKEAWAMVFINASLSAFWMLVAAVGWKDIM